jgi:integrase
MARYPLPDRLPNGRPRYVSRVAATKTEAVVALAELRRAVEAGVATRPAVRTVGQLLDAWLEVKTQDVRPSTLAQYCWAAAKLREGLGGRELASLTTPDVDACLASLAGLSASSVRLVRTTLRAALGYAEATRLIGRNVATLSRPPRGERATGRAIPDEDLARILHALRGDPFGDLVLGYLLTGARRGELLGLRWVDVGEDAITFAGQVILVDGRPAFAPTKTGKARTLPLFPELRGLLERQRSRQRAKAAELAAAGVRVTYPYVFSREDGSPLRPDSVTGRWRRLMRQLGMPWRLHDLRHTTATRMLRSGVPVADVQRWLGHSSISITAGVYGHLNVEDLRRHTGALGAHREPGEPLASPAERLDHQVLDPLHAEDEAVTVGARQLD